MKRVLIALILVLAVQVSWGSALGLPAGRTTTTTNINFPGIVDNKPLRFHVFGAHVLPVEPTASTNVVGGLSGSGAASAGLTAAVARLYYASIYGGVAGNIASGDYATVGGGYYNTASGDWATVGGGDHNYVSGDWATVGGGRDNRTYSGFFTGDYATVGGGRYNYASGDYATVGGGRDNRTYRIIVGVGGIHYYSPGDYATVGGGYYNHAGGHYATVGGGADNEASGNRATVGGGYINVAGNCATVGGGGHNEARYYYATVGGGYYNEAIGNYATVGGGDDNEAIGDWATVGGGDDNSASGNRATVGGGVSNEASGNRATVGGGVSNEASGNRATVGGGDGNKAIGDYATVGGGDDNSASGDYATVGGGYYNEAIGNYATVGGGDDNKAIGDHATVPGGRGNSATDSYSFAAGRRAKAHVQGAFVWADSNDFDFDSTADNEFSVRCTGGARFVTQIDPSGSTGNPTMWAYLDPFTALWTVETSSDRNLKANLVSVDGCGILERLASIPIKTWSYKGQYPSIRHMSPMAQDFYEAFGLGRDEKSINTADADGVALAAIQGLYELMREKDAQIADLKARVEALEALVSSSAQGQ